jgi:integrase-like protein
VPYVPHSYPVVERLIGTVRREYLDRMLFWTAADLKRKLVEFQQYYNEHRTHAGRGGRPLAPSLDTTGAHPSLRGVSKVAALSWPISHAESRVTLSIRSALTRTIFEFATHNADESTRARDLGRAHRVRSDVSGGSVHFTAACWMIRGT